MAYASNVLEFVRRIVTLVLLIFGLPIGLLLTLWAISFIDFSHEPETCSFNSVTNDEYRQLLARAKAQSWTVWPDLSNGLFGPSIQPSDTYGRNTHIRLSAGAIPKVVYGPWANEKLLASIKQLVEPESRSADRELAAAHAVMRSIGAQLFHIFDIPSRKEHSNILVGYSMPQRRFAPLCLFCSVFQDTLISVIFDRNADNGAIALDYVHVMHPKLDYTAKEAPRSAGPCPAFPPIRIRR